MAEPFIYLDHAATTPVRIEVADVMLPFLQNANYGNPSSLHQLGRQARQAMVAAQEQIAALLQAPSPESVLLTSGGTESNNTAIKGIAFALQHKGKQIITSRIEHPSVLESCAWLETQGWQVTYLPVDSEGFIAPERLKAAIQKETVLVSLMHGNNEIGTLQPIETLGQIARDHGVLFHTDAVQTLGKLPLDMSQQPIDLLSASGHKINGPKGVGLLALSNRAQSLLSPLLHGGGQQSGLRAGTENLGAIIGMAKALELAIKEQESELLHLQSLQKALISSIQNRIPSARLNGPDDLKRRVPGNVNFSFPPVEGELLVLRMDREGIGVSSGSACRSHQRSASYVLLAMEADENRARSSIRFSFGRENKLEQVERIVEALLRVLEKAGYFRSHPVTATIG